MDELTIKTNHHWRNPVYGFEMESEFNLAPVEVTSENASTLTGYDGAWYDREAFKSAYPMRYEFDYLSNEEFETREFIRYHGVWYDTGEFMLTHDMPAPIAKWHGYHSDGFFSGIVIRYSDDYEQYQIGTFIS